MLGTMAFQSALAVNIAGGVAALSSAQVSALTADIAVLTAAQVSALGAGLAPAVRNNTALQTLNGLGFPATPVLSTDPNTLDVYAEGSFTGTLTGCTTSPTGTFTYTRAGNVVTLQLAAALKAASNTTACTITGLPAAIAPTANRQTLGAIYWGDSGQCKLGYVAITPTLIDLQTGDLGYSLTAAGGQKGMAAGTFTYLI
jgi:hypothetical protein